MFEMKTLYDLSLHDFLIVDDSLKIRRVPGGWNYEYLVGSQIAIQYVKFDKEFLPKKERKETFLKTKEPVDWDKLLSLWNRSNAIECKTITDDIKKLYSIAESKYTKKGLVIAITNYGKVLNSETKYFFDRKWNLSTFLKQGNCIPNFLPNGETWVNYEKSQSSKEYSSGISGTGITLRTID